VYLAKNCRFKFKLDRIYIKRQVVTLFKKIVEYRKPLKRRQTAELKDLKNHLRNAMKESHPDKFQAKLF
jgi:DnaJ-domain-containing protein 1